MAKTFKGYIPSEQVTFDLESPDGQRKVTIHCKPSVPGAKFLDFMSKTHGTEDFAGMSHAVNEIFEAAIIAEDLPLFWEFCNDADNGVSIEMLAEMAGYLSEQFSGQRPPVPSGA